LFWYLVRKGFGMTLFLGIDGGGTGCRAAVADASGRIIGTGSAGPANIASDPDGARDNILIAARAALGQDDLSALRAGMGLAGANVRSCVDRLVQHLPFARVQVETDGVAAVKGALRDIDGIVAALGTGSVFGVQRKGVVRQIGGWGFVLGDEGSGAWIGRALLARALRAVDGFVPLTPLLAGVVSDHGGADGVVAFSLSAKPVDLAALAPRASGSDDPAARAIMAQAVDDVATAITLLQAGDDLPVVFLGGLGSVYADHLSTRFRIVPPLGTALDGALHLARGAA
jgi:glucosamine kinase